MKISKLLTSHQFQLAIYKLLNDLLLLQLVFFAVMLLAEGILPGFMSAYVSLAKLSLLLFANLLAITMLGKKLSISFGRGSIHKNKLMPIFVVFAFLLLGNSMLKFELWENLLITVSTIVIFFLFYQSIFFSKE